MRISYWSSDVCSSDLRRLIGSIHATPRSYIRGSSAMKIARTSIITRLVKVPTTELTAAVTLPNDPNIWVPSVLRSAGVEIGRAHVELQSLMRISYAVFCLKKKNNTQTCNTQDITS